LSNPSAQISKPHLLFIPLREVISPAERRSGKVLMQRTSAVSLNDAPVTAMEPGVRNAAFFFDGNLDI